MLSLVPPLAMSGGWIASSYPRRKELNMNRIIALLLAASFALLAGCNTVEGAGKDVKATGQAVENAADKAKPK
jgi:entericidin B